jgi:hypothetical protein
MYFSRPDKNFYELAGKFLEQLFIELSLDRNSKLIFDQLGLAYHFTNYQKIIPGLKQIVVDRDPRDVYLDAKNYNAYPITDNIDDFISFYEGSRAINYPTNSKDCLIIRFEDLIFQYDQSKGKIEKFVGLSPQQHIHKSRRFDPLISIKNTETWKNDKNKKFSSDIKKIENKLEAWCYNFS